MRNTHNEENTGSGGGAFLREGRKQSMSTPTIFKWKCPYCGKEEMVMRPSILEADKDRKNAQAIKDETYFRVRCSGCGTEGDFLMNLLYADRERGFLVALQPDVKMAAPPVTAGTWRALRLVRDGEDLADKVRALESPVDDRLIAVAEYLLYRKIRAALPAGSVMGMTVFIWEKKGRRSCSPWRSPAGDTPWGKTRLLRRGWRSCAGFTARRSRWTGKRDSGRSAVTGRKRWWRPVKIKRRQGRSSAALYIGAKNAGLRACAEK